MLCLGEVCRLPTQNYVVELWVLYYALNSLAPGRPGHNSKSMILKLIMQNTSLGTHCVIALQWMSQKLTDEKSTLAQVMAWCFSQCWTLFMSPYGVTRSQWVKHSINITVMSHEHHGISPPTRLFVQQFVITLLLSPGLSVRLWTESCPLCIFYSPDPFHIYTSYLATSEGVSHVFFKFFNFEALANSLNL